MGSAAGAAVGLAPGTTETDGGLRTGGPGLGPSCPPGKEAVLEPGRAAAVIRKNGAGQAAYPVST